VTTTETRATAPAWLPRLLEDFRAGRKAALARAVSIVENHRPGFDALLAELHPLLGRAQRLGLTGPPGAGKSTMTARLAAAYRARGLTVGVIAVDPTSPFTGGALLGDRIRMEAVALDPGVFIRSMATRGSLGGLAAATREVADVLDAFGIDRILIETVGVGQSELDIARTADSSVVVLVPESGDSIQTLKAGLMEIADLFVVNKSDRPGSDRLRNELELMLGLRKGGTMKNVPAHHGVDLRSVGSRKPGHTAEDDAIPDDEAHAGLRAQAAEPPGPKWTPAVLRAVASQGEGIDELVETLDRHFTYLQDSGVLQERRRRRLRERVVEVVEQRVRSRLWRDAGTAAWLDARIPALERGESTPFGVADELLERSGDLLTGTNA
jgi:LAO/AO transport system kinase